MQSHWHLWIFLFYIPACSHTGQIPSYSLLQGSGVLKGLFSLSNPSHPQCPPQPLLFLIYVLKNRTSSELMNNSEGWLCRPTHHKQWPNCGIFLQQQLCKFSKKETTSLAPCFSLCGSLYFLNGSNSTLGPHAFSRHYLFPLPKPGSVNRMRQKY